MFSHSLRRGYIHFHSSNVTVGFVSLSRFQIDLSQFRGCPTDKVTGPLVLAVVLALILNATYPLVLLRAQSEDVLDRKCNEKQAVVGGKKASRARERRIQGSVKPDGARQKPGPRA